MQPLVASDELAGLVEELLLLVQETADYHHDQALQKCFAAAGPALLLIRDRLRRAAQRYVVAMVGLTNVGKSTLLNALLGSELAPRRNGPCTSAPVEFSYGSQYCVTAYIYDQLRRPAWPCASAASAQHVLAMLAQESERSHTGAIHKVVVTAPHPLLAGDLVVADTPGFGAAQIAGAAGSHEQALCRYLREDIAQVFWVVLAEQGIGKREVAFQEQFFADVCHDVVVTGCEDWSCDDRQRFRARFAPSCGPARPTFHFVSGLAGLEARAAQDVSALEAAGITELECRIRELAQPSGRIAAIEQALEEFADDLMYWVRSLLQEPARSRSQLWRPDSWDRWVASGADHPLAQDLTERLEWPQPGQH